MSIEQTPTSAQFSTARDAVTLVRLVWSENEDAVHDLVQSFLNDPSSIPGVMIGLCGIVAQALPDNADPSAFLDAVNSMLNEAESSTGGC